MGNPSKAKGSRYERAVAEVFRESGFPEADRDRLRGSEDCGDITGVMDLTIEAKNRRKLNIAGAVDEALEEAENAGTTWALAAVKRRQKNARESYAIMPLEMAARKHRRLTLLEQRNRRLQKLFEIARDYIDQAIGNRNTPSSAKLRRRMRRAVSSVELGDEANKGLD